MNIARLIVNKFGYELEKPKIIELTLRAHLKSLLSHYSIDLVIDVGANKGQFDQMLRNNGYQRMIYSVEPGDIAYIKLCDASERDTKWHACKYALGSESKKVTFSISDRDRLSSLHEFSEFGKMHSVKASEIVRQEEVEMITLDELIKKESISLDKHNCFLKIDTQGHDLEVFRGAESSLAYFKGMQTEVSLKSIYENVPPYEEVLKFCKQKGFSISGLYTVDRDAKTLELIEVDCVMVKA